METITQHPHDDIQESLSIFKTTSLEDLNKAALLNRTDKKFIFNKNKLESFLFDLSHHYFILDINGIKSHSYKSLYFDTDQFDMYHLHQRGKKNRYKFRTREYCSSGIAFNEVKFKNNKGKTVKNRIKRSSFNSEIDDKFACLIRSKSDILPENLSPSLFVYFDRLTLTDYNFKERITIDLNLEFACPKKSDKKSYNNLIILELKQEKQAVKSPINPILIKHRIFPTGSSKYCLGIYSTKTRVKRNKFKAKIRTINRVLSN